ncbi:hypothetical protein CQA63_09160 [Helicobacter marmotae]|uniref:Uncharacterized protein n=1 Tax=Helicobacter marmotae TaxID=152490 RepID=A0A3D8I2H0_9HELI|nr:hypothetical protein CQA63_09160 [Helicobacter marmotae]
MTIVAEFLVIPKEILRLLQTLGITNFMSLWGIDLATRRGNLPRIITPHTPIQGGAYAKG